MFMRLNETELNLRRLMALLTLCLLPVFSALAEESGAGTQEGTNEFTLIEGTHYAVLPIPVKTRYPDQIEVTEYFSYACPHCFQFDSVVAAWKAQLGEDVVFNRTPAIWRGMPPYPEMAQAYYTAEALGILEKAHTPLFEAIHVERRDLSNPQAMAGFFQRFGVDPMDFVKVFKSFGVRSAMQQAEARGRSYRSGGVPAIIVNGKYLIEGKHAGSNTNMLPIASLLIEKERELLSSQSTD